MSGQVHTSPTPSPNPVRLFALALALGVGVMLGSLGVWLISRNSDSEPWTRIWSVFTARKSNFDLSQPTVVNRIRQLQRLETVVYTMDKVVTVFLVGDRLLLLVHGEVVAGIDFGNLGAGDVKVSEKQVRLRLPDATIFTTRLDSAKTRVYSRQTGLLVPTDPNLESQVRQEAERQLQESALTDGILRTAQQNARLTITSLLQSLGFENIKFD